MSETPKSGFTRLPRNLGIRAGLLLGVTLIIASGFVVYVLYARGVFEDNQRLTLVAEDAEGVTVGMDLTFSGFPIGRVTRLALAQDGKARIEIEVPRRDARWLRASTKTGKNPTDRGKSGSKIHLLVDQRGAPLAIWVTGANEHDKWSVDDRVIHIAAERPERKQHLCADKGYDFEDVHEFVAQQGYIEHIKHRRRRNEPKEEPPTPGKKRFPAWRWVVERTFGWLAKRRSIATRWCKKPQNWLAFIFMACADIFLGLILG